VRHPRHGDFLVALGQRDAQQARTQLRIFLEQLVEIAVAEKQENSRVASFRLRNCCIMGVMAVRGARLAASLWRARSPRSPEARG